MKHSFRFPWKGAGAAGNTASRPLPVARDNDSKRSESSGASKPSSPMPGADPSLRTSP